MPQQDRTGPLGQGPLTGRGLGPCGAGARRGFGRGMGNGFGRRAFGQPVAQTMQPVELTAKEERKILEAEKVEIEKRLKELKE